MLTGRTALLALAGAMLAAVVGAAPGAETRFEFDEPHMGTTFRVVLYAERQDVAARTSRAAFDRVADLDRRLSDYREDSELMRACREAVRTPVPVSPDVFRVLSTAQRLAERTGGAFDVTAGALTRVWRRARRQGALPDPSEIEAGRRVSGYRLMRLGADDQALWLAREGVRIDVGGIAKGYAADRALEAIEAMGVTRAMVVAGGEMALGDAPPGRCGWSVTLAPLDPGGAPRPRLELSNAGVSTSGDAEQWLELGGVRYSHILDPRTGRPLTRHMAVTVVAPDATTSDMLATAAAVLGEDQGLALADEHGAAALMAVSTGGVARERRSERWGPAGPIVGTARTAGCDAPSRR
jgi:thiamine biosynthesis lipoprotein